MNQLLSVKNLSVKFKDKEKTTYAVNGISFSLKKGETLGVVGESGSGKSVTFFSLLGLLPQNKALISGEVIYNDKNLITLEKKELQKIRCNEISIIFQEPMTTLNPYLTIGQQITEPLIIHKKCSKKEAYKKALEIISALEISNPEKRLKQYPHEFSGGQRQRVVIAMALICTPKIIIADEPTTALDVTVQKQVIEVLQKLIREFGTSLIFISHDLGVIANIADNIAVMYAGIIVEYGPVNEVLKSPKHPYTKALMDSLPSYDIFKEKLPTINGEPPNITSPVRVCPFIERCRFTSESCKKKPVLKEISKFRMSACTKILAGEELFRCR